MENGRQWSVLMRCKNASKLALGNKQEHSKRTCVVQSVKGCPQITGYERALLGAAKSGA